MSLWAWVEQHRIWFVAPEFKRSELRKPLELLQDKDGYLSLWKELYDPPASYAALSRALMHPVPSLQFQMQSPRPLAEHVSFDITSSSYRLAYALTRHRRLRLLKGMLQRWKQRSDWDEDMALSGVISLPSEASIVVDPLVKKSASMDDISHGWVDLSVKVDMDDEERMGKRLEQELGKALGPEMVIYHHHHAFKELCISYDEDAFKVYH
jgi:hypothetical protein